MIEKPEDRILARIKRGQRSRDLVNLETKITTKLAGVHNTAVLTSYADLVRSAIQRAFRDPDNRVEHLGYALLNLVIIAELCDRQIGHASHLAESRLLFLLGDDLYYPVAVMPTKADAERLSAHLFNLCHALNPMAPITAPEHLTARVLISGIALAIGDWLEAEDDTWLDGAIARVLKIRSCSDCQHNSELAREHYCSSPNAAAREWRVETTKTRVRQRLAGSPVAVADSLDCPGFTEVINGDA